MQSKKIAIIVLSVISGIIVILMVLDTINSLIGANF